MAKQHAKSKGSRSAAQSTADGTSTTPDSKKADLAKADSKKADPKKADSKKADLKKAGTKKKADKADKKVPKTSAEATSTQHDPTAAVQPAAQVEQTVPAPVDEVHLLRLAVRGLETTLTETESALRRVQQELADERRAAQDAAVAPIEDAVVDAAVAEAVAEAVVHVGLDPVDLLTSDDLAAAVIAEAVAVELDADAAAADVADPAADHAGDAADAAGAFSGGADDAGVLAPPEPVATAEHADDEPNESWTLFRLRAEARRRHVTGFSALSKANLLARLRG